jgi:hypothetical protein
VILKATAVASPAPNAIETVRDTHTHTHVCVCVCVCVCVIVRAREHGKPPITTYLEEIEP